MKNVIKPLAKKVFIPLGLTASVSATDTRNQRYHESNDVYDLFCFAIKIISTKKRHHMH